MSIHQTRVESEGDGKISWIPRRSQSAKADLLGTGDTHSTVKVDDNCGTQSWNNEAWQLEHVIPRCPCPFGFVSFLDG